MDSIQLDWTKFSKEYLLLTLEEARSELKSIRDANKDLHNRTAIIMQYSIAATIGLFVFIFNSNPIIKQYQFFILYVFVCSLLVSGWSMYLWWPYNRYRDGNAPTNFKHDSGIILREDIDEGQEETLKQYIYTLILEYTKSIEFNSSLDSKLASSIKNLIRVIIILFISILYYFLIVGSCAPCV